MFACQIHRIDKIISNKQNRVKRWSRRGSRGVQMKDSRAGSDRVEMNGMETWVGRESVKKID
jgi:hypothetical protein